MDKEALIASLLATYEGDKGMVPLEDEDFVADPGGDWVKHGSCWRSATPIKFMDFATNGTFLKTLCEEVDAMPKHRLASSWERRAIRFATRRADEILSHA